MEDTQIQNYLNSAAKQFEYYKMLGEKTFAQLDEEKLFWTANEESNSIAVIVNHLNGNMISRWTDFLNTDGEKGFRKRDQEFENIIKTKEEMLKSWEAGWSCLFDALAQVNDGNFSQLVYIRNIGHSITEAINRQMNHYAYHIGQIVFIGKIIATEWNSLSIPKGNSATYNSVQFAKPKHRGHFTDDLTK
jgi:hypothetical protein